MTMKTQKSIPQKVAKPTEAFPELVDHLAELAIVGEQLGNLISQTAIAEILRIKKQSFQAQVQKKKERKNHAK